MSMVYFDLDNIMRSFVAKLSELYFSSEAPISSNM